MKEVPSAVDVHHLARHLSNVSAAAEAAKDDSESGKSIMLPVCVIHSYETIRVKKDLLYGETATRDKTRCCQGP